ncbi:hypothetical protein B0H10DRAFT_1817273, partial [Mycena sp. CBHHK59/15]
STPSKTAVPPPKDARKPQVQLRPGPIKVHKTTPLSPPPAAAQSPNAPAPYPSVHTTDSSVSLKSLKETTVRDIAHAEYHGILTPPPPGANWARSTLHKAIQLAKFYYRGVKLVFTRRSILGTIKLRVAQGGAPLARWEFRLMRTQSADQARLIPFVLTALILEEIIPLIVLYVPTMLPSTCILPSQRERIQEKQMDKALASMATYSEVLASLTRAAEAGEVPLASIKNKDISKAICGLLRLSTTGFDALRIRRINRHLEFIKEDDSFLIKEDLSGKLSPLDLDEALYERGLCVSLMSLFLCILTLLYQSITRGLDNTQKVKQLKWWLRSVTSQESTVARRIYLVALTGSQ